MMRYNTMIKIEFIWQGHSYSVDSDWDIIIDDINYKDDFWGEFTSLEDGLKYQFNIYFNSKQLVIFNYGEDDIIDYVDTFSFKFEQ